MTVLSSLFFYSQVIKIVKMANGKKSFVLYADLLTSVEHLTDEELGKLFRHTLEYVNDLDPVLEDRLLFTAWKPIERSLKEDLKKWEDTRKARAEAGRKGGKAKKANARSAKQKVAKQAVSVTDTVTVNDNIKDIFNKWVGYRNQLKKPLTDHSLKQLANRLNKEPIEKSEWVINHSIENGWQGLFWDQYKGQSTAKQRNKIDKEVAHQALNLPHVMERLLKNGWTREEIEQVYNGKHSGV